MKFELYTDAALACDVPEHRLRRGDLVKLVERHVAPDGAEGYSIEGFNALGETIAVTAVPESALEPLRQDEVLCARALVPACKCQSSLLTQGQDLLSLWRRLWWLVLVPAVHDVVYCLRTLNAKLPRYG